MAIKKMVVEPKEGGSKEVESSDQLPVKPAKPAPDNTKKKAKKAASSNGGNK
jgi:hypothetical protein